MANKSSKLEIQVDAETKSAVKDLDRVAAAVDDIGTAATDASSALDSIASGAADAAAAAGDSFGGIVPVFDVTAVLGAVTDLASMAGEAFADKLSDAMDFEAGQDKLQGQLGATAEEAEHLGQLAGDLYSEAFGESMEQVNDVMRRVIQNLGVDALDPALKDLTSGTLDIVNVFEQDVAKTTQALGNLLKTGLVKDGQEGLDLLVKGFQKGADSADDFLDSVIEFSTDFRQIGLSGAQSVGLMIQALKNGARDTDKLADSLAEWRKLAIDSPKAVQEAYKELGIDAKEVATAIGKGGKESADAFKLTLDAIRNLEDPAARLKAAMTLFGTPAEDLAQAFTNIDLSKAVEEIGTVGGAAKELSATVASNADATWTAFRRSIETNVIQFLADNVVPSFQSFATEIQGILAQAGTAWDAFVAGFRGEEPVAIGIEDGKLTSSISAIEGIGVQPDNPTLQMFRDLGEEARKLTDEWGPKLLQFWRDVQIEAQKSAEFLRNNKDLLETISAIIQGVAVVAFLALAAAIGLVVLGLSLLVAAIFVLASPIIAITLILQRFEKTWLDVWKGALDVISRIGQQIGEIIETIEDAIGGLIRTLESFAKRPWDFLSDIPGLGLITGRSVAPSLITPMALGLSPMAAAVPMSAPAPVFNISVQHSGLAVDSPRLQREIVDAIRRYEKREGLIRNPNALASR
jgi:phage-related minor tail protein